MDMSPWNQAFVAMSWQHPLLVDVAIGIVMGIAIGLALSLFRDRIG
jgi:hypothetical protein